MVLITVVFWILTHTITLNIFDSVKHNSGSDSTTSVQQNFSVIQTNYHCHINKILVNMASSGNYKTPPVFSDNKPYTRWVDEIQMWQTVTELEIKNKVLL